MATRDLDPLFVKALGHLHSKATDSASLLFAMVDEAIAARKSHMHKLEGGESGSPDTKKLKHDTPSPSKDDRKEREREKERLYKKEKEKREQEKEKERLEREKQKELELEKERAQQEEMETEESTEDDKSMNADDFAFGLGVCCEVCSKIEITPKNQLVECQECHHLYHQECHKPPVEGDLTDPRFVWYCNKCSKTIKKMHIQSQKQSKTKPAAPTPPSKDSSGMKSSKPEPPVTSQPFQRTEKKLPSKDPQSSSSSQPLKGLASLAANLTKGSSKAESKALMSGWKTEPTRPSHKDSSDKPSSSKSSKESRGEKSSSSSSSSSGSSSSSLGSKSGGGNVSSRQPSMSGSTMATANKKIQMMKRSAAAKQQEKRIHIK
ncbi:hypothetical protein ACOMHN_062021 [Nucella lapillus]